MDAINGGKVVTDVKETEDGRGYVITFNDASTIEVMKKTNGSAISIIEVEGVYLLGHRDQRHPCTTAQ
ncbi:MAG: hypothetical protein ACLT37_14745 [Bacteroides stercoris]